jgi:hypothetical protein
MIRVLHPAFVLSLPLSALLAFWAAADTAFAQTPPTTGNSGCYPDPRIELLVPSVLLNYQRSMETPNIDFSKDIATEPAGRLVDIQWLMGCALCECGNSINLGARVSIPRGTLPPSGNPNQLHSLVIGSATCYDTSVTPQLRQQACIDIGKGAKPFSYWVNAGAPLEITFDPSLIVYPNAKDSCDPTQTPTANTIMLIPDFGTPSVGSPFLTWQTCDSASSSSSMGTGTAGSNSINAVPVLLYAPLQPQMVVVSPGKNALEVSWQQNLTDNSVYQYQVLCMPADGSGPAFKTPPAKPAFLSGKGLCGARANLACDGYSAGGGPTVVAPATPSCPPGRWARPRSRSAACRRAGWAPRPSTRASSPTPPPAPTLPPTVVGRPTARSPMPATWATCPPT